MAISDQINELRSDISNAYDEIVTKGGTEPEYKNTNNLAYSISTIPTGSGPVPTGTINITQNGEYNVAQYAKADVNVSGGGGGIDNTKIIKAVATTNMPANIFVGANEEYVAPAGTPMAIPGGYIEYQDDGGLVVEGKTACAVVWLSEFEFLTIAAPYSGSGKQDLQATLYSVYADIANNQFLTTEIDTLAFNWYPSHFDTVAATEASPAIYSLGSNHFGISYPNTVTENGTTYAGVFETFQIDRANKTVTLIDIFDVGAAKHVVPTSFGGQSALIFHKDGSLYRRNFSVNDGYVFWQNPQYDIQVLDLSNYSDIQSADSYDIRIFSASSDFDGNACITAMVTTSPATSNYICTTVANSEGTSLWSGRTTVTSYMDHIPYAVACNASWDEPSITIIGQRDSSTLLSIQHSPYDFSDADFVDVQMRNASNGYAYRGGWNDSPYPYGGDDITMQYTEYYGNNQVDYFNNPTNSYIYYDMFLSTYDGKSYTGENDLIYNFYVAASEQFKSATIVITKALVDPQSPVVGEEAARYFINVVGTMKVPMLYPSPTESQNIFGVLRSASESYGELVNVEVQA